MGVVVRQKVEGKGKPWSIFIHQNGKIKQKVIGDKKTADVVAAELRKKLIRGELRLDEEKSKSPEFSAFADRYLQTYAKVKVKQNTWDSYETIIRLHLNPVWKGKRLDEIKRSDVRQLLLEKQADGLRFGTVDNIKALISGIFTYAYEEETIQANPALKMGKHLAKDAEKYNIQFLTQEQVTKFLTTTRQIAPEFYPIFLCAFLTGMRLGEVLGLAWEDVDFTAKQITVRRNYTHCHFDSPKSHKSRCIDMTDQLHQVLSSHRINMLRKFHSKQPAYELPPSFKQHRSIHLVFPCSNGKPSDGDNFRHRVFYDILEKAEIPRIRFHDIRHTFASLLLQKNAPIHYVKEQMGHASITTTVDTYGHITPGVNRQTINKLDEFVPVIAISKTA